ncbi:homoserine dehydrogenase [Jonesia quinghaiensis]|uniref:homoserine dehydrogenase n=1 Tax=Jonesia quinghaiensis TaxID=262806 RepID=UPI000491C627|nr:homoserine dehydrogenase [Jonesia quinghaiensis]
MPTQDQQGALQVALLGCGVVGTQVARILLQEKDSLTRRVGAQLNVLGIAVRSLDTERDAVIPRDLLTTDAHALVEQADIVVEVMGGIEPARELIDHALRHGASVVTANKALLAQHGPSLYETASHHEVDLSYEAAVAGAIPIIRPIRESLAGDNITRVLGIVNGTTNYVLDQMTRHNLDLDTAVRDAQRLGYAEADPTADVEGHDAAAKAAILASLAFHTRVALDDVACEGITHVTAQDVAWAARSGHVIKLLAICERTPAGVAARVHPALVPLSHPLASVGDAFNAVFVEAENAGPLMFYGQGAGGAPTASAVMGDLVTAARNRVLGARGAGESAAANLTLLPSGEALTRYQMRLSVLDQRGVLAQIADVFAKHEVSIETVTQAVREDKPGYAYLVVATHTSRESALAGTVEALKPLAAVDEVMSVLRIEGS